MRNIGLTILLLTLSNVFMTFAWYAHLKELSNRPWIIAALLSWGIAFFEYMLQVPGNRIGYTELSVGQLKLLQEVITLSVFVPFAVVLLEGAAEARLPLGRAVRPRRGLLRIPEQVRRALTRRTSRHGCSASRKQRAYRSGVSVVGFLRKRPPRSSP